MNSITLTRKQYYRFISNIDNKGLDECWNWIGNKNTDGYGKFYVNGTYVMAHRISWMVTNGDIPAGLEILHKCDNRTCVNPNHISPGTHQENMDDRQTRGRYAKGERNNSKLKEFQVLEIRSLLRSGLSTVRKIAKMYKVSTTTVVRIGSRKKWGWLQ